VNFVKFKEWLSVVDTQQGTRTPSTMFPNPFRQFVADHFAGEPAKDGSGRTSSAGPAVAGHGSGGDPAAVQTAGAREGFISELRTCHRRLLERIQDGEEYAQKLHEYPAIAAATWVVDAGASYDVVPTGAAKAKTWQRVPLREPLAINTANGRIESTHAVASQVPGMPEKIYAAEMPNAPMLISVGRRSLNHGYSFVWIAGRRP
jgi:hypothetical protein